MRVLRPNGRRRLDEQVMEACLDADGASPRVLLVLAQGAVAPEALEPFAILDRVLGDDFERDLRLVVTDAWPEQFWETECTLALDAADPEGSFDLSPSGDQRRRALEQRAADGRVEVLFVERGRVVGSALTIVARQREDGRPLALNAKLAAMDLLQAARDAFTANPRPMRQLVQDAREALGIPAGSTTSIAEVRRQRGEAIPERGVSVDRVADTLRALSSAPSAGVTVVPVIRTPPAPRAPEPISSVRPGAPARTDASVRPAAPQPAAPQPARATAPAKASPAERHVLEAGRCTRCGKSGAQLDGPCGRHEFGRIGFLELD